jgi:hypothetical protein
MMTYPRHTVVQNLAITSCYHTFLYLEKLIGLNILVEKAPSLQKKLTTELTKLATRWQKHIFTAREILH